MAIFSSSSRSESLSSPIRSSSSSASESGVAAQEALIASLFSAAKLCTTHSDLFSRISCLFAEDDASISRFKDHANTSSALLASLALTARQLQPGATLDPEPFDSVIQNCTQTYSILSNKIRYIMDADRSKVRHPVGDTVYTLELLQTL